jgi:hypothetical protein
LNHELVGQLLGFIMAHSAAIGDSLEANELLVPFVITENEGERKNVEFEADTQELAVAKAEKKLTELTNSVDSWSYCQDGLVTLQDGSKQDVFFYKILSKGMSESLQAYQMYQKQPFKLIGNIQILNYTESGLSADQQEAFIAGLDNGISAHPTGSEKWESWF